LVVDVGEEIGWPEDLGRARLVVLGGYREYVAGNGGGRCFSVIALMV
jgi:hypothetical protein